MVLSCDHGNKPSSSVKSREFLDKLREYGLPKKNSALWSEIVILGLLYIQNNY
jgi:hypothetical protein